MCVCVCVCVCVCEERGVLLMDICYHRWMDMTIITIREASWLTDNTYTYEEVVRMMGDVIAALRGDLRVSCRV